MPPAGIREASDADVAVIVPLLAELGYPTDPDAVRDRLRALHADGDVALVAEVDGGVVGLLTVHMTRFLHRAPDARITSLVVSAASRGAGHGRRLITAAEALAREWGCARIEVTSGFRLKDAYGFYEHVGFAHNAQRFVKAL